MDCGEVKGGCKNIKLLFQVEFDSARIHARSTGSVYIRR